MPENINPRVIELLSWHGHAGGGVHVPFQTASNPLGSVIETPLVRRLRSLAAQIAESDTSRPRWIFLVGGPGNGKSETVQDFLSHLDDAIGLNGALCDVLKQRFSQAHLLPRKVEIRPNDLGEHAALFSTRVSRLIIVQDATAAESAFENAAGSLANDIADLLTTPNAPAMPVFVACANRGLLARAMNEAFRIYGAENDATTLIANVIQACSLGRETLAGRQSCWPLQSDERFACWPLDIDSLLLNDEGTVPLNEMLVKAVALDQWETTGRCEDCTSRNLCPFRTNAESLRDDNTRTNLLALLRRGELARGQRWSFRDAFSLVAELIVGQWSDFANATRPCEWVHERIAAARPPTADATALLELVLHLYHHALFGRKQLANIAETFSNRITLTHSAQPLTHALLEAIADSDQSESTKPIRDLLVRDYTRLDPAIVTHVDQTHSVRIVEEAFCQSVAQGLATSQQHGLTSVEEMLLEIFDRAEREWDLLGRDSAAAISAVCVLRRISSMLAKRSVGVRIGYHALFDWLKDYELCLRNVGLLGTIRTALQPLLGQQGFAFNLVEILGQPTAEGQSLVTLQGTQPGIRTLAAPSPTDTSPGHDVPCIEIRDLQYRIPLTFDFYMALRLRREGCAGSSLPSSVRAALDRVRHRYAGELCRDEDEFIEGRTSIVLADGQIIGIMATGAAPGLIQS